MTLDGVNFFTTTTANIFPAALSLARRAPFALKDSRLLPFVLAALR